MNIQNRIRDLILDMRDRPLTNAISDMQVTRSQFGENGYPLLIVDNFYRDPEAVFALAQSLNYSNPKGKHIHSLGQLRRSTRSLYHTLFELFGAEMGIDQPENMIGRRNEWRFFRSVNSGSDLPTRREQPHSDGRFYLAGLVYLTPDEFCRGGTGFYRHRPTGAEEKVPLPSWLAQRRVLPSVMEKLTNWNVYRAFTESGMPRYQDMINQIELNKQNNEFHLSGSTDVWEMTAMAEMKFNRLVLYPAFAFHHAVFNETEFDGGLHQRRLTQNFFFKYPEIQK